MQYKIRANNQKEAVEVYKAIRQIQQGKHNIAVNADNRKDAVRIYKEAKRVCDSKIKDFGMHNPANVVYNPEYSPNKFKEYVTNIIKLDLCTKNPTPYSKDKSNAIKKLTTYVNQIIDDFNADVKNKIVIRNDAVTWYNDNYTKTLITLINTHSITQHIDATSLSNVNKLVNRMRQSIK